MCESFSMKGDLELLTGVTYEDYEALVPDLWGKTMDKVFFISSIFVKYIFLYIF